MEENQHPELVLRHSVRHCTSAPLSLLLYVCSRSLEEMNGRGAAESLAPGRGLAQFRCYGPLGRKPARGRYLSFSSLLLFLSNK